MRVKSPDAVIPGIMLSDLDGSTISEMLRRDPAAANADILMMTCLGGQMSRLNGLSAGVGVYRTKPVSVRPDYACPECHWAQDGAGGKSRRNRA